MLKNRSTKPIHVVTAANVLPSRERLKKPIP
jgi:hypothetical protein